MSFIPSLLRVLTGAIVLLGASLFLNISGDTGSFEVLFAMAPQAKEKCITIGEKRVCFEDGAKKKNDDDDDDDDDEDDDDKPKKSKDKVIPKKCGKKVRCEPGFVVLDKPNQYGACCEAREGLPPPKTAEPEKCKFPGEVGTPPNCSCPPGTEFMGYKGCVKKVVEPNPAPNGWHCEAAVEPAGHQSYSMAPQRAATEAQARAVFAQEVKDHNNTLTGPVTCRPN